jgi:Tfp pilus assembly protein PilN
MRPVNLLPAKHRARSAGGDGESKASYISLGVLGALVLAVLMYVLTANQVSSRNAEIAEAQQRTQAAEAQAVTLQSYGDFAGTKEARIGAVKQLAVSRLDWERLFRELAHVLPQRVWLTAFDGTVAAAPTGQATGTGSEASTGPSVNLEGCADGHAGVADVMVRLRELHGASDVELSESMKSEGGGQAGAVSADGVTAAAGGDCGPYTSFKIKVTLAPAEQAAVTPDGQSAEVPASLGGGG